MTRAPISRAVLAVLTFLAAGCSYDSIPGTYGSPPPTVPPTTPPVDPPGRSPVNGLWTSSGGGAGLLRISSEQLLKSGTIVAATRITTPSASLAALNSVAFDDRGMLWVASQDDSLLLGFFQGSLTSSRTRTANTVIRSTGRSLAAPSGLAFDGAHRLWVANPASSSIVAFEPDQLLESGAPVPAIILSGVGHPTALAFDADGSLWMADTRSSRIVRFGVAKLARSGSPSPDNVFTPQNGSIESPSALAFDAAGSLWVANAGRQWLVSYSRAQLSVSGSPLPAIVLTTSRSTATRPAGLAFDESGNLWVTTADGTVAELHHASLGSSGTPVPSVELRLDRDVLSWSIAFWPRPGGLPLH